MVYPDNISSAIISRKLVLTNMITR